MKTIKTTTHEYILVSTESDIDKLVRHLSRHASICFDTETTGLDIHTLEIVGMSFCVEVGIAYYVPLPEDRVEVINVLDKFQVIFQDPSKEIIGHNLKYDLQVIKKYGCSISGKLFDTLVVHYLCFPDEKKRKMDLLAEKFLDYKPIPIEALIGEKKKGNKKAKQLSMREVDVIKVSDYAAEDADITFQLKLVFEKLLVEKGVRKLYDTIEERLIRILADIEYTGVKLDIECLNLLTNDFQEQRLKLEPEIHTMAGKEFNINSSQQLGPILFDDLNIEYDADYTMSGGYSTKAGILKKLISDHPIIEKVLGYKKFKRLEKMCTKLPTMVNPITGKLHTSFNQARAASGRISSSKPNLQGLPSKGDGKKIRLAIVGQDQNHVLVVADYSQIELRIIAHFSKDESLINAYKNDKDIHYLTASMIYGVEIGKVTDEQREIAKTVNFGLNYGMTARGLSERLKVELQKDIDVDEAQEMIDAFFDKYCGVRDFIEQTVCDAEENGYTETLMGRKRWFENIFYSAGEKRNAVNFPVQGTAADLIKIAMVRVYERLIREGLRAKIILTVHDELVLDTPISELEIIKVLVKEEMQGAMKLDVDLIAEVKSGINWLTAKKKDDKMMTLIN